MAAGGEDYTVTNGTLTIPAGEIFGTITVGIIDDALDENDENFTLTLSNPQSAVLGDPSTVTVTITDDDLPPEVSFAEAAVTVGESEGTINLGVKLSSPSSLEVSVDFTAADGSAANGEDYTVTNGTLTIPAGETLGTIPVGIIDDALDENDEDFTLSLSNPQIGGTRRPVHCDGDDY